MSIVGYMSEENTVMKQNPILEVKNLKMYFPIEAGLLFKKRVGFIRAVDGIDFRIQRGEILGLVGESGCGKSTTARAIAQLYKPTEGQVYFDGDEITQLSSRDIIKARREMQMIFQDPYSSLNPRMIVNDIIKEPMEVYKNRGLLDMKRHEINERIEWLMERVGLSSKFRNRYPHEFSGGQRQRIGIARALALNPKVILADEPVSALDVSIQAQILNLMMELQDELGLTYLFIAHDLGVVKYISTRIAVMYLGKIVEIADTQDLFNEPLHPYTQALISAAPIPDPILERARKRIILEGDVPSPDQERTSCYFYDRCPKKMSKCRTNVPELKDQGSGHLVSCFLYGD